MAVNCTPQTLPTQAECFQCISKDMRDPVELYLLAAIANGVAGTSMTPAVIARAAAAFRAIPKEMREPVKEYLLCSIAQAVGA